MMLISETLVELVNKCPCGKPLDACIFNYIRNYDKKQQIRHILGLSLEEKVSMIKNHKYCKTMRENHETEVLDLNEFQDFI
ncbi:MAG: hypothetical protein Kow0068_23190 [Marinilabiliales bacterium]